MATSIAMPQLGESVTEGTVGRWLKAIGERVEKDEPLVEVVTDKVNVEIPSPEAGYLVRIAVEEGQTVPVGAEIALLDAQPGAAPARAAARAPAAPPPARLAPAASVPTAAGDAWQPLTPMRRAIAEHMVRSVSTAPHVTMCVEIDVTGIARRREAVKGDFKGREGFDLTYLPFVAKALAETLREHPILNARFQVREG